MIEARNNASNSSSAMLEEDEDKVFDDWYEAAEAKARRGEPNPYGLGDDDFSWLKAWAAATEPTEGGVGEGDGVSVQEDDVVSDLVDCDEDEDEVGREATCDHCGGSGFRPSGDGAQCGNCGGLGTVTLS